LGGQSNRDMRGYFDNDEPEVEEPEELEDRRHDTEVTLSTGAQLGIVFCLLLLCGLCFGLGYWVGHRGSGATAEKTATQPTTPTAAPDQEPLQGNGTLPKPSADAQVPPQLPPESSGTPPAPASDTSPAPTQPEPTPAPSKPASPPATKPAAPPPARPATPVHTAPPERASEPEERHAAPPVPQYRPAPSPAPPAYSPSQGQYAGQYMVQIAAVLHAEDANVLVNALRNHGFAATAQRMPDGLVHVRIGPFATHEEASRMSMRLLADGYNAMVQP